jgi:GntR family transcriptional regulator
MFDLAGVALRRGSPIPLYYQLKQCILQKIDHKELQAGDQIPNEMDFVEALGISRSTVRQALNELVSEGRLNRVKAKGTFISKPKVDEGFFQRLTSFNDEMIQKGRRPSTLVLGLTVVPPAEEINRKLRIPPQSKLICLCRLRSADGEPIVYLETYLCYDRYAGLLQEDFTTSSLYSALETRYSARVAKAIREIEAVNASSQEAKYLGIDRGDAVCLVKTVGYLAGDVPVEYSVAQYRGDRNLFTVELIR